MMTEAVPMENQNQVTDQYFGSGRSTHQLHAFQERVVLIR